MTFYCAASEFEAFQQSGTMLYDTSGTFHSSTWSRGAMNPDSNGSFFYFSLPTAISSGKYYARARYRLQPSSAVTGGAEDAIQLRDSSDNVVVDLFNPDFFGGSPSWTLRANIGGVMTDISGNLAPSINNVLTFLDIIVDFDNTKITLVQDDSELTSAVISFANIPDVKQWRFWGDPGFGSVYCSEVVIADQATTGRNVFTKQPTGNGAVQGQTAGDYTDIDELALNTSDLVTFASSSQEATFTGPSLPVSDRAIDGVMFVENARRSTADPDILDFGYRTNGSNFYPGSHTLDTFFANDSTFVATNADTGTAFTPSEIDSLEQAFRSNT